MAKANKNKLPRWSHFLIAVLLSTVVILFRGAVDRYMEGTAPFLFSSIAVLVAAFIGGFWPGILATAITTTAGIVFFLAPDGLHSLDEKQRIIVGANITVCVSISLICGALRSSELAADQSAKRLRTHIDSITDALVIFRRDMLIASFNQAAATLWGLKPEDVGAEMNKVLPKEVCDAVRRPVQLALEQRKASNVELSLEAPGLSFDVRLFPSEEGVLVYFRDITDKVASDSAIEHLVEDQRRSNAFLDSLLSHAPLGFAFFNRKYEYERINEVLADINGFTPAEHIGKSIRELLPVNAPLVEPIIDRVFQTGEAVDQLEITGETPREPGVTRHWLTGFYPVTDSIGLVRAVGAVVIEITQRKAVEEQLRESEQRFRNLADNSPMMIWVCNPDGSANWFNRPWLEFRDMTLDDAICEGCFANIHPEDEPWVKETYQESYKAGEPFSVEYRTLNSANEYRWIHVKANPVEHGDARSRNYLMSSIDITDRTAMEEHLRRSLASERAARSDLETANRLKDEFLAGLSHELRTPLTTILGWAELLMKPTVRETELQDGLEIIQRSSKLQLQLISDLLDMSRISVGKITLEFEYGELCDLVQSVIDLVQPSAAEKQISVGLRAPADPVIVRIDPDRFMQIVWNLLSNAIKFTPKGGNVSVDIVAGDSSTSISVTDTGIGIEESFLPYVFDRFRQADAGRSRKHGGLGLGLAIAKQLAELHEGNIEVFSEGANKGCTFTLTLPMRELASLPTKGTSGPEREQEDGRRLVNDRILLVEDDESSRDLLKKILELEGASVAIAGSAPAARKLMRETNPDILVSDIGLPDEDGYQLIRSIRSGGTENSSIPAIALTAFAGSDDRLRAFEAGFTRFLTKPVDAENLVRTILEVRLEEG